MEVPDNPVNAIYSDLKLDNTNETTTKVFVDPVYTRDAKCICLYLEKLTLVTLRLQGFKSY